MADNLVLGRGKIFFAPYAFGQTSGGAKGYFGNTPMMTLAQSNTKLDHFSSEGGLKVKDRSIILQNDMTVTFDTDNINLGNLALWFGGASSGAEPFDAPGDLGALAIISENNAIYGALFFESDNPVGDNANYWFPYVNLTPNGNFALKGDTWQQMSFTAECLKRDPATERLYVYTPVGGLSTAAADTTTPMFTPETAGVGGLIMATGGTLTIPGTGTVDVGFNAVFALTGGTVGYAMLHDGTANVPATLEALVGNAGTVVMTALLADTYTAKLFDNSGGTGVALATSGTIVVS